MVVYRGKDLAKLRATYKGGMREMGGAVHECGVGVRAWCCVPGLLPTLGTAGRLCQAWRLQVVSSPHNTDGTSALTNGGASPPPPPIRQNWMQSGVRVQGGESLLLSESSICYLSLKIHGLPPPCSCQLPDAPLLADSSKKTTGIKIKFKLKKKKGNKERPEKNVTTAQKKS